jgi:DNA-binding transcriptional regulator YiaG
MLIEKLLKRAGGRAAVAHTLGVSVYNLIGWERINNIPDEYVERVAHLASVDPKDVNVPEKRGRPRVKAPPTEHEQLGLLYRAAARVLNLKPPALALLHSVTEAQLTRWKTGEDAAPLWAFEDIYYRMAGEPPQPELSMAEAIRLTGLKQSAICDALGVSRASGTVWKKAGRIPLKWSVTLRKLAADRKRVLTDAPM